MGWKALALATLIGAMGCDDSTSESRTDGGSGSSSGSVSSTGETTTDPGGEGSTTTTPATSTGPTDSTSSSSTAETSSGDGSTTAANGCANGVQDGDEADIDCGGSCGVCPTGSACTQPADCEANTCETGSCLGPVEGCELDDVQSAPGGMSWADSYSVDGRCYCASSFDHNIADIMVDTPAGPRTVFEVCEAIGPGPGIEGNPVYNDIQCGNGPANDAGDEDWCPGRVDEGEAGCCTAGPTWDLSVFER